MARVCPVLQALFSLSSTFSFSFPLESELLRSLASIYRYCAKYHNDPVKDAYHRSISSHVYQTAIFVWIHSMSRPAYHSLCSSPVASLLPWMMLKMSLEIAHNDGVIGGGFKHETLTPHIVGQDQVPHELLQSNILYIICYLHIPIPSIVFLCLQFLCSIIQITSTCPIKRHGSRRLRPIHSRWIPQICGNLAQTRFW